MSGRQLVGSCMLSNDSPPGSSWPPFVGPTPSLLDATAIRPTLSRDLVPPIPAEDVSSSSVLQLVVEQVDAHDLMGLLLRNQVLAPLS